MNFHLIYTNNNNNFEELSYIAPYSQTKPKPTRLIPILNEICDWVFLLEDIQEQSGL